MKYTRTNSPFTGAANLSLAPFIIISMALLAGLCFAAEAKAPAAKGDLPFPPAKIYAAGFMQSYVTSADGGGVWIWAYAPELLAGKQVEVYYQGVPFNLMIPVHDAQAGIFFLEDYYFPPGMEPGNALLELYPRDALPRQIIPWPYLHCEGVPIPTATPTVTPTPGPATPTPIYTPTPTGTPCPPLDGCWSLYVVLNGCGGDPSFVCNLFPQLVPEVTGLMELHDDQGTVTATVQVEFQGEKYMGDATGTYDCGNLELSSRIEIHSESMDGTLELFIRAQVTEGSMDGTVDTYAWGTYEGIAFDCNCDAVLTASFISTDPCDF